MFFVCLFADDDVKTNGLELYFCEVFRYKCFCKKLYFGYCNLFIRKDLLDLYLLGRIKSLVGYLQFMVGQKQNLVGHLVLLWVFPVGQNVRCVFPLVEQILIMVGHRKMSDRCFKACVKSVRIRSFSGLYFLAFRLNTERYSAYFRIHFERGKIRTRKTPNMGTFHAVLRRFFFSLILACPLRCNN